MTSRHGAARRAFMGTAGAILVEVMVAVLLAGVLVSQLAAGLAAAVDRAGRVDAQAALAGSDTAAEGRGAWIWGPSVSALSWEAGPVLQVQVKQRDRADEQVAGLWTDGWFLGECALGPAAMLKIGDATWEGLQGRELVVRVREADGEWGPPWRSVVPDVYGDVAGEKVESLPAAGEDGVACDQATVVHVPALATPVLGSSWNIHPSELVGLGVPQFVIPSTPGLSDIAVGGSIQTWLKEEGRVIDLYF